MRGGGLLDTALEATVVGGFSRIGFTVRSWTQNWSTRFDLAGRRVLITGGTSGIGLAAATAMARSGARVAITGRDQQRLDAAAERIDPQDPPLTVRADSADLPSLLHAFDDVVGRLGGLDVLVNNAGALTHDYTLSPQGFELTYAVHVLAPFALTARAVEVMDEHGMVITTSSGGMYTQRLDVDEAEMGESHYDGVVAYARAKRAQVALTEEWGRRHPNGPAHAAMHPGWADTPGVADSLPGFRRVTRSILRTPEQGADTLVWLAAQRGVPTGGFWLDRQQRSTQYLPGRGHTREQAEQLFEAVRAKMPETLSKDSGADLR